MYSRINRQSKRNESNHSSKGNLESGRSNETTQAKPENTLSLPSQSRGFNFGRVAIESPNPISVQPSVMGIQRSRRENRSNAKVLEAGHIEGVNLQKTTDKLFSAKVVQSKVIQRYDVDPSTYTVGDLLNHNMKEGAAAIQFVMGLQQNAQGDLQQLQQAGPSQGFGQWIRNMKYQGKVNKIQSKIADYQEVIDVVSRENAKMALKKAQYGEQSAIEGNNLAPKKVERFHFENYQSYLGDIIAGRLGISKKVVKRGINDAFIDRLNADTWNKVTKELDLVNPVDQKEETFTSVQTPVNENFDSVHYAALGNTGQASATENRSGGAANQMRTTNLWKSELKKGGADGGGETIFEAFRTGTLAYSGKDKALKKNPVARENIARSKVRGLLEAILVDKLKKMPAEQREQYYDNDDMAVDINLVSTSLQTASLFSGEDDHIEDQVAALNYYDGREEVFNIDLGDDVVPHQVKANISTIAFNFAVNGLKPFGYFGGGKRQQHNINQEAIRKLGLAYDDYVQMMEDQMRLNNNNRYLTEHQVTEANTKILVDMDKVTKLWNQIQARWESRGHAYELPARIANMAFLMGHTAHYNCKSGKDRTGMQDVESKLLAHQIDSTGDVPEYENELDDTGKENYGRLLFGSGSLEIQNRNTGVSGYKIANSKTFEQRIRQRMGNLTNLVKGLSKFTHA